MATATATTLVTEIARRNSRAAGAEAAEIPAGSTIRNIEAALRMGTEVPRTSLAVPHVETHSPTVRRMPDNRLADREEICPAIVPEEPV
jgi:hypothetical protein